MLEHTYHEYELNDKSKHLDIEFYFENSVALALFLSTDVYCFATWIKEDFDKVMSGEEERIESFGNATSWEIRKDKTRIDFLFPPDENDEVWCEVDTKELRALVDEWCEKSREFDKKHNKK